jgi:UDP-glucose 4-epimerase
MKVLVTGGAGYIGSHMVKKLQKDSHNVVVIDNFSTGHKWAINDCEYINLNLLDKEKLSSFFKKRSFDVVVHFAARSIVSESINSPSLYYLNNFNGSLNLVSEMIKNDIFNIVFSSTAAIFGNPLSKKINEKHPFNPINPYGKSKLMVEYMLMDFCKSLALNAVCFRYFNAAGADTSEPNPIGESRNPETHLIPNVLKSIIKKTNLEVFGNDYNTKDGTCIRDYIHVIDLIQAHMLGISYINENSGFSAFNLGNGNGFSVLDVIKECESITGDNVHYNFSPRRQGDPGILVADSSLARENLGWIPKYNSLNSIIKTAWKWHNIHDNS